MVMFNAFDDAVGSLEFLLIAAQDLLAVAISFGGCRCLAPMFLAFLWRTCVDHSHDVVLEHWTTNGHPDNLRILKPWRCLCITCLDPNDIRPHKPIVTLRIEIHALAIECREVWITFSLAFLAGAKGYNCNRGCSRCRCGCRRCCCCRRCCRRRSRCHWWCDRLWLWNGWSSSSRLWSNSSCSLCAA